MNFTEEELLDLYEEDGNDIILESPNFDYSVLKGVNPCVNI